MSHVCVLLSDHFWLNLSPYTVRGTPILVLVLRPLLICAPIVTNSPMNGEVHESLLSRIADWSLTYLGVFGSH